jgi:hypothetical protein
MGGIPARLGREGNPVSMGTMGRPKKKTTGGVPDLRNEVVAFRCRGAYRAWLDEFGKAERSIPSVLIDQGLAMLAKSKGFKAPPER